MPVIHRNRVLRFSFTVENYLGIGRDKFEQVCVGECMLCSLNISEINVMCNVCNVSQEGRL